MGTEDRTGRNNRPWREWNVSRETMRSGKPSTTRVVDLFGQSGRRIESERGRAMKRIDVSRETSRAGKFDNIEGLLGLLGRAGTEDIPCRGQWLWGLECFT